MTGFEPVAHWPSLTVMTECVHTTGVEAGVTMDAAEHPSWPGQFPTKSYPTQHVNGVEAEKPGWRDRRVSWHSQVPVWPTGYDGPSE